MIDFLNGFKNINFKNDENVENSVIVTKDGKEGIQWKFKLVEEACQSIEISGNYGWGEPLEQLLVVIYKKLNNNPNIKVRLIFSKDFINSEDESKFIQLKQRFSKQFDFLITPKFFYWNFLPEARENHIKLVVIDEKYYVAGGTGFQISFRAKGDGSDIPYANKGFFDSHVGEFWRDCDIVGKGDIAKKLRIHFFELYQSLSTKMGHKADTVSNSYFKIDEEKAVCVLRDFDTNPDRISHLSQVKALFSNPWIDQENPITGEYCRLINNACPGEKIYISHMFLDPNQQIMQALKGAVKKGCKVRIITNGISETNSKVANLVFGKNALTTDLLMSMPSTTKRNRPRIYAFNVSGVCFHKKIMVVGKRVIIGSYNLGEKSHGNDRELALSFESEALAVKMHDIWKVDKSLSLEIAEEQVANWKRIYKLLGFMEKSLIAPLS